MSSVADLMPDDGWIRRYVDLYEPLSEATAEAHMATALAVLSAAIGWRAFIRWGESSEPCTLYVILEGESAIARKTTTMRTGSTLVRKAMEGVPNMVGARPPLSTRGLSHTSRRGLLEMVSPPDEEAAKAWDDVPPPGLLVEFDEIGALLGRPGDVKGQDWLGATRLALMEFTSGRHGGLQTGGDKMRPGRCSVSLLGTITRQELEQRVSHGLLRDGFLGRFVLIPHPGRRRYLAEPPEWTSLDSIRRDELATFLRRVATSKQEIGSVFRRMTNDARQLRSTWYDERMRYLDARAAEGSDVDIALSDAMGRLQTTAVKIAAVMAVSRMDPAEDLGEVRIDVQDVEKGIAFAEHALSEIADLAGCGGGMPADRYAEQVVAYLARRNGHGPVTRARLMDAVRMDGMDATQRWRVCERLHEEGRIEIEIEPTATRPRMVVSMPRGEEVPADA